MTRCKNLNHYVNNGTMVIVALVKLYIDFEY